MRWAGAAGAAVWLCGASGAALAAGGGAPPVVELPTLDIYSATPLAGAGVDIRRIPAAVTQIGAKQIEREKSPTVVKALTQQTPSVDLQAPSGNDLEPDVIFRGFEASPVEGTPQGLAVYQDGVRMNEAFGDTVHWDFIPAVAVRSMDVVSNNPAFGLNALGGAVAMTMKDGFHFQGTTLDLMGGSFGRAQGSLQWGKQVGPWAAYIAIEGAHDSGYRRFGGTDLRRAYADIGYKAERGEFHLSAGGASNFFGAAGTTPFELLQQGWGNVYTTPQSALDQVGYVNAKADVALTPTWRLQANAYVRSFYQATQDGNPTDVQPCADPTLLCFGDSVTPANGLNGTQLANPFSPTATLGENDRTFTQTTSVGTTAQATNTDKLFGHDNRFTLGASFDYGVTHFGSSAELGIINPDYTVSSSGLFLGPSGSPVSIGPVSLRTTNAYTGLYALDAFDVTDRLTLTAGGRFNLADIRLQDQIGTALNGGGDYARFNPLAGLTYKLTPALTAYAGYSEANRAPTPLELGCADPLNPCILASFLVADPPLKQVVARTLEAGLRGDHDLGENGHIDWRLGVYRTGLSDDIENVALPLQGYGYFANVGSVRRQGIEASAHYRRERLSLSASYAYLDATYQSAFQIFSNAPDYPGGVVQVRPGDEIPMTPHHRFKFSGDFDLTPEFSVGVDVNVVGAQYYATDAANQEAKLPAYGWADLDASYKVTNNLQLYAKVENLFDNRYFTYGTFFDTTQVPNYGAGGAAFTDPRSLTPARPRAIYAGMRATF